MGKRGVGRERVNIFGGGLVGGCYWYGCMGAGAVGGACEYVGVCSGLVHSEWIVWCLHW